MRYLDYVVLVNSLEKYGFKNDKASDKIISVKKSLELLINHWKTNYKEKENFFGGGLMLNPVLCSYFEEQLKKFC